MFAVLSRTIPRRAAVQSVRWMSQKPPTSRKTVKATPKPTPPPKSTTAASDSPQGSTSKPSETESPLKGPSGPLRTPPSGVPTLDFSPEPQQEFQRTGARSSKGALSSSERKRRSMSRVMLALLALAFTGHTVWMGREWEDDELKEKKMKREDAPTTRWGRTLERYNDVFDIFNKPAWPELLPPPYPPPHQKPYTLLISLDDMLITSTWDRQHGWRTAKRPGIDYFLGYISQFYEVVIFTTQPSYTAALIVDKLDRYGFFVNYRLYREATRTLDGKIVKDLSYLNRDLSKVVMLDTDPEHVVTHPENAVILPKWKGDPKDKNLVAMIPFLESIAIYKPPDVRPILKAYEGKNIPIEYGKIEAEMKVKHAEEWKAKHKAAPPTFGSLFGVQTTASAQPKGVPPPTYLETKRKEAQQQYLDEQKYIADHREELEKLLEQDQAMAAAQVPGNLWAAMDQLRGGAPPHPGAPGAPPPAGQSSGTPAPTPPPAAKA